MEHQTCLKTEAQHLSKIMPHNLPLFYPEKWGNFGIISHKADVYHLLRYSICGIAGKLF